MSKSLIGRKIKYAKLQNTDAFIPGIGALGATLPSPTKTIALEMTHTEEGLHVIVQRGRAEAFFPWGNVQIVVYENENPPFKVVDGGKSLGTESVR